jgi:epsilon-lactone hydrolase
MSKQSKILELVLKKLNFKESVDFLHPKRSKERKLPSFNSNQYLSKLYQIDDYDYVTIEPIEEKTLRHIVYFHGGGYSHEASIRHFHFIKKFLETKEFTVSFINYPLAPENEVKKTLDIAFRCYEKIVKENQGQEFVLMGDSAGGGLALALAMYIRNQEYKMPHKIILFSPWLDIALKDEQIQNYESLDLVLSAQKLREIGDVYSRTCNLMDYRVSPLYGDLNQLGEIAVFYGTHEIFYPDCKNLCNKTGLLGTTITPYEHEEMQHDWVMLPFPESDKAIGQAIDFILDNFYVNLSLL